jgi:MFS family permease
LKNLNRLCSGIYGGFIVTTTPRLILECFPVKKRARATTAFSFAICTGVAISFTPGFLYGDEIIVKYWRLFFMIPSILSMLRIVIIYAFFNHDSPSQYSLSKTEANYRKMEPKINNVISKFSPTIRDYRDSRGEVNALRDVMVMESGFWKKITNNLCDRRKFWPLITVIAFQMWPTMSGLCFTEFYSTEIYDNLMYKGFGYSLTFWNGIMVFCAGLSIFLFVDKFGRRSIIINGCLIQIGLMYFLTIAFYCQNVWMLMISSMFYTFVVYFSYMGVCFLYANEIAESFNVAVGLVMFWILRCILAKVIPLQINT